MRKRKASYSLIFLLICLHQLKNYKKNVYYYRSSCIWCCFLHTKAFILIHCGVITTENCYMPPYKYFATHIQSIQKTYPETYSTLFIAPIILLMFSLQTFQ